MFTIYCFCCSFYSNAEQIQLILQITFASRYQFCHKVDYTTVSTFSLRPYCGCSAGTSGLSVSLPSELSSNPPVFPPFHPPPREVLTSSEERDESQDFICLPQAPGLLSQRAEKMEKKKEEETMKTHMILLSPFLTQSACFPSVSSFPLMEFSSLSRFIFLWAELVSNMKKI